MFSGLYVHNIDPIIASVGGVHLWWYGLSYSLGFLNAYWSIRRRRTELGFTDREVLDLVLLLAIGVMIGGRLVVLYNERAFYLDHPALIPAVWLGGMATHGLIIGGFAGVGLFCAIRGKPYRVVFDALAIPTAVILAAGRLGNFIDGQIVGSVTTVPWAVKFPEAEGFRHPVVLYDGLKNLLIIPILLWTRRRGAPAGRLAALFVFLYAFVRIFIDLYREYPLTLLGLPAGQTFNVLLAGAGLALLARNVLRGRDPEEQPRRRAAASNGPGGMWWRRTALVVCLIFPLVIASDATRDIPKVYGHRHPGLRYTSLYVPIR